MSRPEDGFTPTLGEVLDARAKSAPTLAEALHVYTCGPEGDACCWESEEIKPCAEVGLTGIEDAVLAWFAERLAPITAPDEVGDGWVRVENIRALVAAREEVGPQ